MSATTAMQRILGPRQRPAAGPSSVTLRYAGPADSGAIERLARLDSNRPPRGAVLLAEVLGEPWAAISIDDHHAVADPFRPTGELVALLHERVRQLRRAERGRLHALPRVWPAGGRDELDGIAVG